MASNAFKNSWSFTGLTGAGAAALTLNSLKTPELMKKTGTHQKEY